MSDRHIVQQPKFIFFIKIAQIVLGFLLLALTAFALSEIKNVDGTFGFNIFCVCSCSNLYVIFTNLRFSASTPL